MTRNPLFGKDITSIDTFDRATFDAVRAVTGSMQQAFLKHQPLDLLKGRVMTALFYEPSSRTFASFVSAMQHLGGGFMPLHGVESSSVAKDESFEDTVRTFAHFSDLLILRHPQEGSSQKAADLCSIPVINAGDGGGEHPTQAVVELMTVQNHIQDLHHGTITVLGDLLYGRTIHSLVKILSLYPGITLNFVSPHSLRMPKHITEYAVERGVIVHEAESPEAVLPASDAVYMNRIKKERFSDPNEYERLKHWYRFTPETMNALKPTAILMHPLPRADEIDLSVDADSRAVYLTEQLDVMVPVRMAILAMMLCEDPMSSC